MRPKLLFLSPVVPATRGNGLAMRTGFFLQAYASRFDVDLAVFPVVESPAGSSAFLTMCCARFKLFEQPPVDAHFSLISAMIDKDARLSAFYRYGRPSLSSRLGASALQTLAAWVGERCYAVIHVERLYMVPLAERWLSQPRDRRPRLIVDCDDDDSKTYRRLSTIARMRDRIHAAEWLAAEGMAFSAMARRELPRFDEAFIASGADAMSLAAQGTPVSVVPNVIWRAPVRRRRVHGLSARTILFVASMGYAPNEDGARWFLTRIWPRLRRAVSGPLRLVLAGSNPSQALCRLGRQQDVRVTGTVEDMSVHYRSADLVIIPVRAGGGTRIKLLEAVTHRVPVVSTTIGAEGTTFRHGRDLLLADTSDAFLMACLDLLGDRERAARMAERAFLKLLRNYNTGRWSGYVATRAFPAWRE